MRIHLPALPHTLLVRDYDYCAYTAKLRRFVQMLANAGHEPLVYGPDIHDCPGAVDYSTIVDEDDRKKWFGSPEWDRTQVFDRWDANDICWLETNTRAIDEIEDRWEPHDKLGIIAGLCQKQIVDGLAHLNPMVVEWGIGYSGILDNSFKVFESYAWAHHVAGLRGRDDLSFFDSVIPNCFDPADLTFSAMPGDYLLYMGRPTARKGLAVVAEMAKRLPIPVKIAGQPGLDIPNTENVGMVVGKEKAELIAGARAVLAPTVYLEPFGGIAVEAMMSGTPVITTDWGAFTETVLDGVTGYRCKMLHEFLDAADKVGDLNRKGIGEYATARFSTAAGSQMYSKYFQQLDTLYDEGWYSIPSASTPT